MKTKFKEFIILILLFSLAFGIRIYKINTSPEGLYIDEASIGYNAYSLLTTGKDEHGFSWPLFFKAFGEWKLPVYIYSVFIAQLFLGPTDLSVRLPAVVFGSLSAILLYLWVKELLISEKLDYLKFLPFLSGFLLVISPWHFQYTHTGFEASAAIFFILVGLWLFFKAVNHKSNLLLHFSFLAFAGALYSYNSARIVVPGLFLLLIILYRKSFKFWDWLKTLIFLLLASWSSVLFFLSPEGLVRAKQVSIFFSEISNPFTVFVINYWKNISPVTLFIRGEPTIAHLTPYRWGLLYFVELTFFFLGLINLIIKRNRLTVYIFGFLFIGFIPPAIGNLNPHALRASLAIPAVVLISAWGFSVFLKIFKQQTAILVIYIILLLFSLINFLNIYHNFYTIHAGWDWQVGIKRASEKILQLEKGYGQIFINNRSWGSTTITYLWYLKIPPRILQSASDKNNLGKYHFEADLIAVADKNSLVVGPQFPPTGGLTYELVDTIYYPNEKTALYLWRSDP